MAKEPPYRIKNMVPGMIMLWHGSVATIPSGWHLCDGTVGTPDLRNRFIICAEQDDSGVAKARIWTFLYQSGGADQHAHDFLGDGHAHDLNFGQNIEDVYPDGDYEHHTGSSPGTGTTDVTQEVPRFYALCYIMKL